MTFLRRIAALALPAAFISWATGVQAQVSGGPGQDLAQSSAWANEQLNALYALAPADGWFILDGGVRFRRVSGDGTGPAPTVRDVVSVNYAGRLTNGEVFDSTEGRRPATFPLGQLIRAWQVAIPYMGVGDTIEIAVPAELGYGARGAGPIPPGATLFFTIELLDVMVAPGG